MTDAAPVTGVVLRVDAKVCHVQVGGMTHVLPLRGRLFEERGPQAQPVAVGDRVVVRLGEDGGAIEARLPRQSKLGRARRGGEGGEQVLAANVTLVLVVAACAQPRFQPDLVDRILAGAAREQIEAALVITKLDRDRRGDRRPWVDLYRGLGIPVFETSVAEGHQTADELGKLRRLLAANTSLLSGASGAGKSSLLNALCPGLNLRIGSMSRILQGRHTTTHTQMIPLPGGGHVLDAPGIRGFGLFGADPQELQFLWPELRALVGTCDYRNCLHTVEPGCAVRAAAEAGKIAPSRYDSYRAVLAELGQRESA